MSTNDSTKNNTTRATAAADDDDDIDIIEQGAGSGSGVLQTNSPSSPPSFDPPNTSRSPAVPDASRIERHDTNNSGVDDKPPLPLKQQRLRSDRDSIELAVAIVMPTPICPDIEKMSTESSDAETAARLQNATKRSADERSPHDEESVPPRETTFRVNDDTRQRPRVEAVAPPPAEERDRGRREPSIPLVTAYLVEENSSSDDERDSPVYDAIPIIEPEAEVPLPWWKLKQRKVFVAITCGFIASVAIAVGLGVTFLTTSAATSRSPSQSPANQSYECFASRFALKTAIEWYGKEDCGRVENENPTSASASCSDITKQYGWPIGKWCVSDITDMSSLFEGMNTFNEDISGWEVGHVTDMSHMFSDAKSFNRDISSWNTASVTDMSWMFRGASSFNGNLSSWDTTSVGDMDMMFSGASSFNGNISAWNTSSVADMSWMFSGALSFNGDLSSWDTSSVADMSWMFSGASSFNGDLSTWDTSSVTDMTGMFSGASSFNGDLSRWNTSSVAFMSGLFKYASSFNGNLSFWNTSSVTGMFGMCLGASSFNGDLTFWNSSSVNDMRRMFYNASSFNQPLCAWRSKNFPYANADEIFSYSACTFQENPNEEKQGPFCASDCN